MTQKAFVLSLPLDMPAKDAAAKAVDAGYKTVRPSHVYAIRSVAKKQAAHKGPKRKPGRPKGVSSAKSAPKPAAAPKRAAPQPVRTPRVRVPRPGGAERAAHQRALMRIVLALGMPATRDLLNEVEERIGGLLDE